MKHGLLAVKYLRNFARQAIPEDGSLSFLLVHRRGKRRLVEISLGTIRGEIFGNFYRIVCQLYFHFLEFWEYIYIRRERRNVEELINCIDIFVSNYLFCIELKVFRNIILIFCIRVIYYLKNRWLLCTDIDHKIQCWFVV